MKKLLKDNLLYLIAYVLLLCIVSIELLSSDKVQIHRAMNSVVGNPIIDRLFLYLTHLGDGLLAVIIALIISLKNVKQALYILLSYVGAGIVSYILKHWVYYEVSRPHFTFQYFVREPLKLVDGVDILALHSFPSGHSLSAFALFFCLIFITQKHWLKIMFFTLAVIAAYSRVYLSQHWLVDIFVGSIIGVLASVVFYGIFYINPKTQKLNIGLRQLTKKQG